MSGRGWVGFDLDGTLAIDEFDALRPTHIGPPVAPIVALVRHWLTKGVEVRIFTARVGSDDQMWNMEQKLAIREWTLKHLGRELRATSRKDMYCITYYDDRAIQVEKDIGVIVT